MVRCCGATNRDTVSHPSPNPSLLFYRSPYRTGLCFSLDLQTQTPDSEYHTLLPITASSLLQKLSIYQNKTTAVARGLLLTNIHDATISNISFNYFWAFRKLRFKKFSKKKKTKKTLDNVHHTVWANGFVLWTGFLLYPSAHAELVFENQDKIPNLSQGHSGSLRVTPDKAAIKRSSKEGLALSEWLFAFAFCSLFLQKIRVAPGGSLSHLYPRLHQVPLDSI